MDEHPNPYLTAKFLTRTVAVDLAIMLICFCSTDYFYGVFGYHDYTIANVVDMLGGYSIWVWPILIVAIVIDVRLPAEPLLAQQRSLLGRLISAILVYLILYLVSLAVFFIDFGIHGRG